MFVCLCSFLKNITYLGHIPNSSILRRGPKITNRRFYGSVMLHSHNNWSSQHRVATRKHAGTFEKQKVKVKWCFHCRFPELPRSPAKNSQDDIKIPIILRVFHSPVYVLPLDCTTFSLRAVGLYTLLPVVLPA